MSAVTYVYRHLTTSQRAMAAVQLANMSRGDNQYTEVASNEASISQTEAAELLNVSRASVQRAAELKKKAPELAEQVAEGELTLGGALGKRYEGEKRAPRGFDDRDTSVGKSCPRQTTADRLGAEYGVAGLCHRGEPAAAEARAEASRSFVPTLGRN